MLLFTVSKAFVEESCWVTGKTPNGELIIGYIDKIDPAKDIVRVTVVNSDNEDIVGDTIEMLHHWVETIPSSFEKSKTQLEFLIDLALETKDEEWFLELSAEWKKKEQKEL